MVRSQITIPLPVSTCSVSLIAASLLQQKNLNLQLLTRKIQATHTFFKLQNPRSNNCITNIQFWLQINVMSFHRIHAYRDCDTHIVKNTCVKQ